MTDEQITELAIQAGSSVCMGIQRAFTLKQLQAFAQLVRNEALEEAALKCDEVTDYSPCACIGPINGEPHCPCTMVRLKLTRNPNQYQKRTAEAIAKATERSVKVAEVIIKRGLKS